MCKLLKVYRSSFYKFLNKKESKRFIENSVMDFHSKKIIGYSMDKKMDTALAIEAVKNDYYVQKHLKPLVLHSYIGSQYTSKEFSKYVLGLKIIHSFSSKGCSYDNACIESFHDSLRKKR